MRAEIGEFRQLIVVQFPVERKSISVRFRVSPIPNGYSSESSDGMLPQHFGFPESVNKDTFYPKANVSLRMRYLCVDEYYLAILLARSKLRKTVVFSNKIISKASTSLPSFSIVQMCHSSHRVKS